MSFDYWYAWYPARFRADTLSLTCEEDGIYRRLIDHYMETRLPLPDDDQALERISGSSNRQAFAKLRPYFRQANGKLHLKKCDEILAIQEAKSQKNARNGQKGGINRALKQRDIQALAKPSPSDGQAIAQAEERRGEERREENKDKKESKGLVRALRGTRLPPDWELEQAEGEWAMQQGMTGEAVVKEAEKFKDYWTSKSGAGATKTDWKATWRNWIRKHLEEYAK